MEVSFESPTGKMFVERPKISRSMFDMNSKFSKISKIFQGWSSVILTILQKFQTAQMDKNFSILTRQPKDFG